MICRDLYPYCMNCQDALHCKDAENIPDSYNYPEWYEKAKYHTEICENRKVDGRGQNTGSNAEPRQIHVVCSDK